MIQLFSADFIRGVVSTAQAATHTWSAEMALRFLMGMFEAGYGPGIPYLLSFFYLRHEVGFRCGIFLSAAPLANTFAGALAYGITSGHSSIANWRVLFLVEGLPTIAMAVVAYFFLPDSPEKARFLTAEEKFTAKARGVRQAGSSERIGGIDWKDMAAVLIDPKAWLTGLMYFSCNVSFSSLPVFLPTILKEMGFSAVNAQGLTAPPFFVSFLLTVGTTYIADRTQQRGFMLIVLSLVGGIGYVILASAKQVGARYFGVFMAAAGIFPAIANILPWVLSKPFPVLILQCATDVFRLQTTKAATLAVALASYSSTSSANVVRYSARASIPRTKGHSTSKDRLCAPRSCSSQHCSSSAFARYWRGRIGNWIGNLGRWITKWSRRGGWRTKVRVRVS